CGRRVRPSPASRPARTPAPPAATGRAGPRASRSCGGFRARRRRRPRRASRRRWSAPRTTPAARRSSGRRHRRPWVTLLQTRIGSPLRQVLLDPLGLAEEVLDELVGPLVEPLEPVHLLLEVGAEAVVLLVPPGVAQRDERAVDAGGTRLE